MWLHAAEEGVVMKQEKKDTIRTIYLYIFSVLGLVLLVIGTVGFVNLLLKSTIFKEADADYYYMQPPMPYGLEKVRSIEDSSEFTDEEKAQVRMWLADYSTWEEQNMNVDYIKSQNQRSAAQNLALIIVGLPLYLYHWRLIRKYA